MYVSSRCVRVRIGNLVYWNFVLDPISVKRGILHDSGPSWLVSMLGGLMSCGIHVHVTVHDMNVHDIVPSWPEALSTACVTLVCD